MERESDILEEIILPERAGVLGSKIYQNVNGKILKTTRLGFCDSCGTKLDENKPVVVCCTCGRKLCSSDPCKFELRGKTYCNEHIQQMLPLSFRGFEVLHCILAEVDPWKVCELAHATRESCKEALNELLEAGYIEKRGIFPFSTYRTSDRAIIAWTVYAAAYSRDGDVAHFESELTKHLQERLVKRCR
jgi:hypothetical protein